VLSGQGNAGSSSTIAAEAGRPSVEAVDARDFDAVIFDLDGVITRTARVHAAAWKRLFDDFLRERAGRIGVPFQPFEVDTDYPRYVDGKPRFEGVASFLQSRGIALPWGEPDDNEDTATIYGLGNRKNRYFHEHLAHEGAAAVLEAARLVDLFDAQIDGVDLARLNLKGKPAPDLFLLAADRLGVAPARAIVVEDAVSGVEAGKAGRFRHVIGIDRHGHPEALRQAGADLVVSDLAFLKVDGIPLEGSEAAP